MGGFEKLKKLLETSNDEGLKSEIVHLLKQVEGVERLTSGAGGIMNVDPLSGSAFTVTPDVDLSVLKTSHFAENSSQVGGGQPQHLLYEGDNMLALTLLQGTHAGAVDTIYIDPPYNTGNEFTYDDKRVRAEGSDPHSHWLSTMYPRLCLAYNLLKPSGVFFVSIDDREQAHLKLLCDRVFGEQNFITQMVWDGGTVKNNASLVSTTHEYVLVYAKSLAVMKRAKVRWRETRPGVDKVLTKYDTLKKAHGDDYVSISAELKKWIPTAGLPKRLTMFTSVDHRGPYTYADLSAPNSKGARYPLHHPTTGKPCRTPTRGWAYTEETLTRLVEDDRVIFGPDETSQPLKKLYLHETTHQVPRSILNYPARAPTHLLKKMIGTSHTFTHPKSLELITHLISISTPKNGIVLDFFAGSGTAGHAVAALNTNDGGTRQFILATDNSGKNTKGVYVPNAGNMGICRTITYPRLKAALTGQWADGKPHPPLNGEMCGCVIQAQLN